MSRKQLVLANRDRILEMAAECNVADMALFGSTARQEDGSDSDCDFLADYTDETSYFDVCRLRGRLMELLGCEVDVVSRRALPRHMRYVETDAVRL